MVVPLDSVDSAAAVVVPVVPVPVPHEAELPVLAPVPPGLEVLALAQVLPDAVLLHLLPLLLPQVVVESGVTLHLQGRQSFSAAMARSSRPTVQPTYGRAPSTRSPPKGRLCPSASRNWMPVRG